MNELFGPALIVPVITLSLFGCLLVHFREILAHVSPPSWSIYEFLPESLLHEPPPLWMLRVPVVIAWVVAVGEVILTYRFPNYSIEGCPSLDGPNGSVELLNPDIGGIGVRLGLYVPLFVSCVSLFAGHWHAEPSGVKELCLAQLASMYCCTVIQKPDIDSSIR